MILLINNYSSKYWLNNEIKDCSNNLIDNNEFEFEISINSEKLKDNYNNINNNNLNGKYHDTNTKPSSRNKSDKNSQDNIKSKHTHKNKNNRTSNKRGTNPYIELYRTNDTNNNQRKMSTLLSTSRISEYKRRDILLDSYTKPKLKNNS